MAFGFISVNDGWAKPIHDDVSFRSAIASDVVRAESIVATLRGRLEDGGDFRQTLHHVGRHPLRILDELSKDRELFVALLGDVEAHCVQWSKHIGDAMGRLGVSRQQ